MPPLDRISPLDSVQKYLGGPAGFTGSDFDLLINFRTDLPPSPSMVRTLLKDPREADSIIPNLRRALTADSSAAHGLVNKILPSEPLWPWIDVTRPVEPEVLGNVEAIAGAIRSGESALRGFAGPLNFSEHAYFRREAPGLFRHDADDTLLGPIDRERARLQGEGITDSVLALAARLPLSRLAEAARDFDAVLNALMASVRETGADGKRNIATENLLAALRREGIPVIMGTAGDDVHHLNALLAPLRRGIVFDPGGNDRYDLSGLAQPGGWLLILDASGDDVYQAGGSQDTTGDAAAFAGLQIIADLDGDDRYEGGDFAFGSAIAGFSRLYDAAGDDTYTGRCASLGFAFHGVGILQDQTGNDIYSSAYLSQGAPSTFGLGILLDEAGDDAYVSRPEYLDDLRYRDRFLSLSQGFSTGFAPDYGGGIAVLWDRAGDDVYQADIFGQGSGYWFGWGLLMDDEGNDSLRAYQYAQGAGVHFAVGMLWDGTGDDRRVSKGVSQGCGHDGGFGLFVDASGNDHNTAVDMSAGAGSANGLGIMTDHAGDDTYSMGNPAMTLGHADMRRDRASMGFFLDQSGRDTYPLPQDVGKSGGGGATAKGVADTVGRSPESHGALGRTPASGTAWRTYDGVRRGNGLGLDAR